VAVLMLVGTTDSVRILPSFHLRLLLLMLRVLIKLYGVLILSYFYLMFSFLIFFFVILVFGDSSCHFASISVTSILHLLLLCGFCLLIFLFILFCFRC
jgi:hypothetical protein